MATFTDGNGTWEQDGDISILVSPSETWYANQPKLTRAERLIPLRAKRDDLLDQCDTTYCNADKWELMDAPTKTLWRTYKQALRDLPEVIADGDIDNPTWPVMPGA